MHVPAKENGKFLYGPILFYGPDRLPELRRPRPGVDLADPRLAQVRERRRRRRDHHHDNRRIIGCGGTASDAPGPQAGRSGPRAGDHMDSRHRASLVVPFKLAMLRVRLTTWQPGVAVMVAPAHAPRRAWFRVGTGTGLIYVSYTFHGG